MLTGEIVADVDSRSELTDRRLARSLELLGALAEGAPEHRKLRTVLDDRPPTPSQVSHIAHASVPTAPTARRNRANAYQSIRPRRRPSMRAAIRELTRSARRTARMWLRTVSRERPSDSAICAVEEPRASRRRTSYWRASGQKTPVH